VVEYIADHVAVMQRGRIVEAAPTGALLANPLESYTQELLAAVPRLV
jgi:peptide/nickel transport system ATP-binding protein